MNLANFVEFAIVNPKSVRFKIKFQEVKIMNNIALNSPISISDIEAIERHCL